jgi:glyoxylase-like metal-dependent hydrolase (beta-lactamase superfamily II)
MKAMQIEKVKDNLYIITGSGADNQTAFSGGNVAVFITDAGVTPVDTKLPGFGPTILERIKTVTGKPVTRIINTHTHGDHTGGNSSFGGTVESIVQENTRTNMTKMPEFSGANAQFLPKRKAGKTAEQAAGEYKVAPKFKGLPPASTLRSAALWPT